MAGLVVLVARKGGWSIKEDASLLILTVYRMVKMVNVRHANLVLSFQQENVSEIFLIV